MTALAYAALGGLGDGMLLVAIGLGLGLIGAGTSTQLVRATLFDLSSFDPATFATTSPSLQPSHFLPATFRGVQPAWILSSISDCHRVE
jgi:hypothetical protein